MTPLSASLLTVGIGWLLIFSLLVIQGKPTRRVCWKSMVNFGLTLVLLTLFLFAVFGFNEPGLLLALSVSVPTLVFLSVLIFYLSIISIYAEKRRADSQTPTALKAPRLQDKQVNGRELDGQIW